MTKRDILERNDDLIARAARILMKKPRYALSAKPFRSKQGSRGVVINAASKIERPDSGRSIARVDVYLNGRPYESIDAEDGAIHARRITLRTSRSKKTKLVLEARDGANKLLAACRRTI